MELIQLTNQPANAEQHINTQIHNSIVSDLYMYTCVHVLCAFFFFLFFYTFYTFNHPFQNSEISCHSAIVCIIKDTWPMTCVCSENIE